MLGSAVSEWLLNHYKHYQSGTVFVEKACYNCLYKAAGGWLSLNGTAIDYQSHLDTVS